MGLKGLKRNIASIDYKTYHNTGKKVLKSMSKIHPVDKSTKSLSEVTISMAKYTKLKRIIL